MCIISDILNHGSWQTEKSYRDFCEKYTDEGPDNIIFSRHCRIMTDFQERRLSNNAVIFGDIKDDAVNSVILPNLFQAGGSYVVTDTDGKIYEKTKDFFERQGYDIQVLNLCDMSKSMKYNPFMFLKDESDVIIMTDCLLDNTWKNDKERNSHTEGCEEAFLNALIFYMLRYEKEEHLNMDILMQMISLSTRTHNILGEPIDLAFERVRKTDPEAMCAKEYDRYLKLSGDMRHHVAEAVRARLSVFTLGSVKELVSDNEFDFKRLADTQTVLYIIIPEDNAFFTPITGLFIEQMTDALTGYASGQPGKRALCHIQFLFDRFTDMGVFPLWDVSLNDMLLKNISCMMCVPDPAGLQKTYPEEWTDIISSCDVLEYLGTNNPLPDNKELINIFEGRMPWQYSLKKQIKLWKERERYSLRIKDFIPKYPQSLKAPDMEKAFKALPANKCIVSVADELPFYDRKA